MDRNLHVIYPADEYIPSGDVQIVPLTCTDGFVYPKKVTKVLLHIITDPAFSVEEVTAWGENVIVATKILNPCDMSVIYVAEYINDVLPWVNCCGSAPIDENFYLTTEDGEFLLPENGLLIIV